MRNKIKRLTICFLTALLLMNTVIMPMTEPTAGKVEAKQRILIAKVNYASVKLYKQKTVASKSLKTLHYNDTVTVLTNGSKWVKVKAGRVVGYAQGKFFSTAHGGTAAEALGFSKGEQVANFALKFVGNPYVWGGTSLTKGADCSGFVMSVYRHFGKKLPHSSAAQRRYGKKVRSLAVAKAGDIICYNGHVAIYLGNRMIVHASSRKTGIKVSNNAAYRHIVSIRRMFN